MPKHSAKHSAKHLDITPVKILDMVEEYRHTVGSRAPRDLSGYPVYMLRNLFSGHEPSLVAVVGDYEMFVVSKAGHKPAVIISRTLKAIEVVGAGQQPGALASGDRLAHKSALEYLKAYVEKKGKKE